MASVLLPSWLSPGCCWYSCNVVNLLKPACFRCELFRHHVLTLTLLPLQLSRSGLVSLLQQLLQLAVLGLCIGLACWPFNLVDRLQDQLLRNLPAFSGAGWSLGWLALAVSPLLLAPLLVWLQRGPLRPGAGSGIPQTMSSIEAPERAFSLLGLRATLARFCLWTVASLSLMPLGREGPVVQVGAAVASWLRRRFPTLLPRLSDSDLYALAAGAGLAGGFNTPLMGAVFVVEEFARPFIARLLWPALLISGVAAAFSNLAGQPEFALGVLGSQPPEWLQVLWAVPIGLLGGLVGASFSLLLLRFTRFCLRVSQRYPLGLGCGIGAVLSLFMLFSGGSSGGDGEALMTQLISGDATGGLWADSPLADLLLLLLRLLGPVLALGVGIPGGLIDPSFALGAVLGRSLTEPWGLDGLGIALGMAAGLAGACQLPVMTVLFALRLAGDQQLLPGLLVAAVLAACVSRVLMPQPIYHALHGLTRSADPPESAS